MIKPTMIGINSLVFLLTLFSVIARIPLAPIPKGIKEIIVPKGVLHCPKTDSSAVVLLFELKETKQYGD